MRPWKFLLLLFISLILAKSLLSSIVLAPSMFSDEYEYAKMAQSFWHEQNFNVHNTPGIMFPPLYPIILSPTYAFEDMRIAYLLMKIINAIISSFVIFPAYLLSKEFMGKKRALLTSLIVGILPATFSFAPYLMSENLFLPLFLFSVYAIYKTIAYKSIFWGAPGGVLIAATFYTRTLGVGLIVAIAMLLLINLFFIQKSRIENIVLLACSLVFILVLWVIRNSISATPMLYQYSLTPEALGTQGTIQIVGNFLFWFITYIGYITLATGFLPMLNIMNKPRSYSEKEKTFFMLVAFLGLTGIAIASKHNINPVPLNSTFFSGLSGRPIGRYIEYLFPLIIISGFSVIERTKMNKRVSGTLTAICIISAIFLSTFVLLPINNGALSLLGILKVAYEYLAGGISLTSIHYFLFTALVAIIIALLARLILKNYNEKNFLISFIILLFLLTNAINYTIAAYNSKTYWYDGEQMQLGLWINDNNEFSGKTFLIDEMYEGKILKSKQEPLHEGSSTIIGFWLNKRDLKISSIHDLKGIDYVITRSNTEMPLIKKTNSGINLYEVLLEYKK